MNTPRRHFLKTAAAFSLGFGGLHRLLCSDGTGQAHADSETRGFGPLLPDPAGILDLPRGFTYRTFSTVGEKMDDGFLVPHLHDGMAAFPGPRNTTILVRNHEMTIEPAERGPFGPANQLLSRLDPGQLYDWGEGRLPCLGGTTTVVYDMAAGQVKSHFLSLAGTMRNCAGGPTPWNTWISCEESTVKAENGLEKDHGYNFEVPASTRVRLSEPLPLKAMGRFVHEAVAVEPQSGIVYQTEDRADSLIYRFIPDQPGRLQAGGRLQAMKVKDRHGLDTRNWEAPTVIPGQPMAVEWIDLEEVESPQDDLRLQGFARGAALFARGEGMWYGNRAIYFACTSGGRIQKGQIWRYWPSPDEGQPEEGQQPGTLELFIQPDDAGLVDNADNVTVTPWGDLILCEDGPEDQFLVGVTPEGQLYKFAHNVLSLSEFAGSIFSPDGTTLFVNIQGAGMSLAIQGPWKTAPTASSG